MMAILKCVGLLAFCAVGAAAQEVTVRGRVTDPGDAIVIGASIQLSGHAVRLTAADGSFTFERVVPGRYKLTVRGLGYAPLDTTLVVSSDTSIILSLERSPVQLDTLIVESREVKVRGEVRDPALDMDVVGAAVYATDDRHAVTDPHGRFDLGKVPANVPLWIRVEEIGFLPMVTSVAPDQDTILQFQLVPDPVAVKTIERQKARIDERAADLRYEGTSVIDRPRPARVRDASLKRFIRSELGTRWYRRVDCWVLDERAGAGTNENVKTLSPEDLEYIDILRYGPERKELMVRIYTRDFILSMIGRPDALVPTQELRDLNNGSRIRTCK
ncbi:MAG: carboxypeptidase-like regulatory domain-containing protein [Gemmatimonadota bacterium]|jgi:hypothetical protein